MRILLLSQWCFPEPEIRITSLANSLTERGHQVAIITGFPNYPYGRIYPGYRQRLWQRDSYANGLQIVRLPLYPDHTRSTIRRSFAYMSFALSATVLGPFFSGKPDVMWVYQPPLTIGIPAIWISLMRRIPFIYEIQDMWPETVAASGMLNATLPIRMLGGLAKIVYRQAAAITVISDGFKSNLETKGVPSSKIHVIPNWADEAIYRPVDRDPTIGEQYHLNGRFNVVFAGTMGPAQGLSTVIKAAEILREIANIQFVLIGDGLDLPSLKSSVDSKGLKNVLFIDRQPAEQIPQFLAWGDALLVQLRNDPLFHLTIPSKTLTYMASGRPIICAVPGDAARLIRESGAGLICPPDDPQALADAVRQACFLPDSVRDELGRAGRQAFLTRFTREKLIDDYEAVFRATIQ